MGACSHSVEKPDRNALGCYLCSRVEPTVCLLDMDLVAKNLLVGVALSEMVDEVQVAMEGKTIPCRREFCDVHPLVD